MLSVEEEETPFSMAEGPAPALARVMTPAPEPTEKLFAAPLSTQVPPVVAEPQPFVCVRSNVSEARGVGPTGAATVTSCATVSVAPRLSVTVSFTVYVPALA